MEVENEYFSNLVLVGTNLRVVSELLNSVELNTL